MQIISITLRAYAFRGFSTEVVGRKGEDKARNKYNNFYYISYLCPDFTLISALGLCPSVSDSVQTSGKEEERRKQGTRQLRIMTREELTMDDPEDENQELLLAWQQRASDYQDALEIALAHQRDLEEQVALLTQRCAQHEATIRHLKRALVETPAPAPPAAIQTRHRHTNTSGALSHS